jgi:iron(III) transport system ATP-binding protein
MSSVNIRSLTKSYGKTPVLRDLDLAIAEGEFLAVIGESGCGKTTLLRIIAGFEVPDSGEIRVGERILDAGLRHLSAQRRNIGYVSQEGTLFPHLDVTANVAFGLPRGSASRQRAAELLELLGLTSCGTRYPHQLSGGQQQRVALARTLAVQPGMILLDEPFASLDTQLREQVRSDMKSILRKVGATVILVTQDQEEAMIMSDRVAVVRDGAIAQVDRARNLYEAPVDEALARFLGPVNVLPGNAAHGTVTTSIGPLSLSVRAAHLFGGCDVAIRPEQIHIMGEPAAGVGADVIGLDYLGAATRVSLRIQSVGYGPTDLTARVANSAEVAVGDRVRIHVDGTVHAWPASEAAVCSSMPASIDVAA